MWDVVSDPESLTLQLVGSGFCPVAAHLADTDTNLLAYTPVKYGISKDYGVTPHTFITTHNEPIGKDCKKYSDLFSKQTQAETRRHWNKNKINLFDKKKSTWAESESFKIINKVLSGWRTHNLQGKHSILLQVENTAISVILALFYILDIILPPEYVLFLFSRDKR